MEDNLKGLILLDVRFEYKGSFFLYKHPNAQRETYQSKGFLIEPKKKRFEFNKLSLIVS